MNKAELIDAISGQTGQTKEIVNQTLDALMETVGAALAKDERVLLVGFGTFDIKHRAARPGRNPQTGETIEIPAAILPRFTPGKFLKERIEEAHKPKAPAKAKSKKPKAETAKAAPAEKPKKTKKN